MFLIALKKKKKAKKIFFLVCVFFLFLFCVKYTQDAQSRNAIRQAGFNVFYFRNFWLSIISSTFSTWLIVQSMQAKPSNLAQHLFALNTQVSARMNAEPSEPLEHKAAPVKLSELLNMLINHPRAVDDMCTFARILIGEIASLMSDAALGKEPKQVNAFSVTSQSLIEKTLAQMPDWNTGVEGATIRDAFRTTPRLAERCDAVLKQCLAITSARGLAVACKLTAELPRMLRKGADGLPRMALLAKALESLVPVFSAGGSSSNNNNNSNGNGNSGKDVNILLNGLCMREWVMAALGGSAAIAKFALSPCANLIGDVIFKVIVGDMESLPDTAQILTTLASPLMNAAVNSAIRGSGTTILSIPLTQVPPEAEEAAAATPAAIREILASFLRSSRPVEPPTSAQTPPPTAKETKEEAVVVANNTITTPAAIPTMDSSANAPTNPPAASSSDDCEQMENYSCRDFRYGSCADYIRRYSTVHPVAPAVAPVTPVVVAPVTSVVAPVAPVIVPVTPVVAPVTPVVAPVAPVVAPVAPVVGPFAEQILQLKAMGFDDIARLERLLHLHRGNVSGVVSQLIQ